MTSTGALGIARLVDSPLTAPETLLLAALAVLAAAVLDRLRAGRTAVLAAAYMIAAHLAHVPGRAGGALPPFLSSALGAAVAYRLASEARATRALWPRGALLAVAGAFALFAPLLAGGALALLLRTDAQEPPPAAPVLFLGTLLLVPDGTSAALRHAGFKAPLAAVAQHVDAILALTLLGVAWLFAAAGTPAADPAPELLRPVTLAFAAAALGAGAGGVARVLSRRNAGGAASPASLAVHAGAFACAELLHSGLGILAGLAGGLAAPSGPGREGPGSAAGGALSLGVAALAWTAAGTVWGPVEPKALALGLGLWLLAAASRALLVVACGGLYRLLRPHELDWTRILGGALAGHPGTLGLLAWIALAPGENGAAAPPSMWTAALLVSLLLHGGALPVLTGERRLPSPAPWEREWGRRLGLRAAIARLRALENEGVLDSLPRAEVEALRGQLEDLDRDAETALESAGLPGGPEPARAVRILLERELALAAAQALEDAAARGALRPSTAEAVAAELAECMRLAAAPAPTPPPTRAGNREKGRG